MILLLCPYEIVTLACLPNHAPRGTITVINALFLHNKRKRAKGKEVVRHADFITDIIDSAKTAVSNIRKSLFVTGKKDITDPLQNA
jgi:hypothetical protein